MFNNIFITSLIHFWHYPCAFTFYSFPKGLSNMAKKRICLWQQEIIRTIWFHFHWKSYFLCTPCSFFSLTSSRFYFLFHLTMCRSTVLDTSPRLTIQQSWVSQLSGQVKQPVALTCPSVSIVPADLQKNSFPSATHPWPGTDMLVAYLTVISKCL